MSTFDELMYQLNDEEDDTFESELLIDDDYDMYSEADSNNNDIEEVKEGLNKAKKIKKYIALSLISITIIFAIITIINKSHNGKEQNSIKKELKDMRKQLILQKEKINEIINNKPSEYNNINTNNRRGEKNEELSEWFKNINGISSESQKLFRKISQRITEVEQYKFTKKIINQNELSKYENSLVTLKEIQRTLVRAGYTI